MDTFKPRLDILPEAQRDLWTRLLPTLEMGFTLYGGTAVALRLGHRQSVDFDFFTDQPLDKVAIRSTMAVVANGIDSQNTSDNTLHVTTRNGDGSPGVKLSFFGDISFGRVGTPSLTDDGILQVASLDDLMATKLKVIVERAERKDYHDIAAMLDDGVSLGKGLAAARLFFGDTFVPEVAARAIGYHKDGNIASLPDATLKALTIASRSQPVLPTLVLLSRSLSNETAAAAARALRASRPA